MTDAPIPLHEARRREAERLEAVLKPAVWVMDAAA